jgi:hypothetical protein
LWDILSADSRDFGGPTMPQIDYNLLTLVIGTGTLILLLVELRSNHTWNQKRTSYELLNDTITSARMTGAMQELQTKFGWDILAGTETYDGVTARLKPASTEIQEVNQELVVIMRHLEMVCISISHRIVSERIAWDAFFVFFERIYASSLPFIEKERVRRENPHIYENFEHYALKWKKKPPG